MKKVIKVCGIVFGSILSLCIILYIVVFSFCYKYINVTNDEYKEVTDKIQVKDNVNITKKDISNYMTVEGVKFRNDFSKFKRISRHSFTYYEYKDKENKNSIKFWVSSSESRMCSKVNNDTYRTNIDCDITIKDINNVKNYKLKNINFSVLNIIDNFNSYYDASYYLDNLYQENPHLSNYNNATYYGITGDYNGIVSSFDYSGYKNVKLFSNGKTYQFGFDGHGYFTDSYINDFISTVVFL